MYPNEYIVLTAHLDHVGIEDGEIYNGADDDGSGTVALLEIAQAFKKACRPKRSILFLHVTGEEIGLYGSRYYTENPLFPLSNTVVNLNVDMIGRIGSEKEGNDNYVYLIGSDHDSVDLHNLSEQTNTESVNMTLDYRFNDKNDPNRFYYRSDHYNFAKNGIPIIFYFTGTHEDYHKLTDTPDKIEYDLLERRSKLIFYTAWNIANRDRRIIVDPKPEKVVVSLDDLKHFTGVYSNSQFPTEMKIIELNGSLAMVPNGRSDDEAMELSALGDNKFKIVMAGIDIEFIEKKMKFNMGGREIMFDLVPPPPSKE